MAPIAIPDSGTFRVTCRRGNDRWKQAEQQLMSFSDHTRDNPFSKQYMWGAAASLSPQTAHALAVYFSRLPARAAYDGDRQLVAKGEMIYQRGMPEANIAVCVACHAPDAEGVGAIPRLGGLAYTYLKKTDAVGSRIPRGPDAADAAHCELAVARRNRGARVIPQLCKRKPIECGILCGVRVVACTAPIWTSIAEFGQSSHHLFQPSSSNSCARSRALLLAAQCAHVLEFAEQQRVAARKLVSIDLNHVYAAEQQAGVEEITRKRQRFDAIGGLRSFAGAPDALVGSVGLGPQLTP